MIAEPDEPVAADEVEPSEPIVVDDETMRFHLKGLGVRGVAKMSSVDLVDAIQDHVAMRMREELSGRMEDKLNSPSRAIPGVYSPPDQA